MKGLPLVAAACALALSCSREPIRQLDVFVGTWEGTHRIAGDETVHPASYRVMRDGDALVWEFRSEWGGGFEGRGELRWDAAGEEFVETWTDSLEGEPSRTRGSWDSSSNTLTMRGEGADWETGETIAFTHRTWSTWADEWSYVMTAERAGGDEQVMWIVMRRE